MTDMLSLAHWIRRLITTDTTECEILVGVAWRLWHVTMAELSAVVRDAAAVERWISGNH